MIIAMRLRTARSPASLLCCEARNAEVIQRDAGIAAINFISGHEGWALQPALERNFGRSCEKVFFPSLPPVIY